MYNERKKETVVLTPDKHVKAFIINMEAKYTNVLVSLTKTLFEWENVCMWESVCVRERGCVCVCVCVLERERERVYVCLSECVCVF